MAESWWRDPPMFSYECRVCQETLICSVKPDEMAGFRKHCPNCGFPPEQPTIPPITDERLAELARRIKPVTRAGESLYQEIQPVDLKTVAFTWDPKPRGKPFAANEVMEVPTFHNWGYYGLFKPSLAEVFACIQHLDLTGITHLALRNDHDDTSDGYHKGTCTLLSRRT